MGSFPFLLALCSQWEIEGRQKALQDFVYIVAIYVIVLMTTLYGFMYP